MPLLGEGTRFAVTMKRYKYSFKRNDLSEK